MDAAAGLLQHDAQAQVHLCHVDATVDARCNMMYDEVDAPDHEAERCAGTGVIALP